MKCSKILKLAKKKIANKKRWCKEAGAKDSEGNFVDPQNDDAIQWCALGAIEFFDGTFDDDIFEVYPSFYLEKALHRNRVFITTFNDNPKTTHKQIMALYDRAIKLAEKDEYASSCAGIGRR